MRAQDEATLQERIEAIAKLQLGLMEGTSPGRRGQHGKPHGLLWGWFEVLAELPESHRVGLFAQPRRYLTYVRFSNGAQSDDRRPDIHGMALKLTGVAGQPALEGAPGPLTQDFVLADHPVFFIRTAADYVRFMEDFARSEPQGKPPLAFLAWLGQHRPEDLPVVQGFRQQLQTNPCAAQYWSQVPYAFGESGATIARYRVRPLGPAVELAPAERDDPDYLRRALARQLTEQGRAARFEFAVQLREGATPDVIDNPTVLWETPFVPVASLVIPPQDFCRSGPEQFGEALVYTPWHALQEHRPLGEINEIRRAVYVASARLRHERTGAAAAEPSGCEYREFGLRWSREELTQSIDADFVQVVERLQGSFNLLAQMKRGRATHTYGVVARGEARCIVPLDFPPNDVFVPGKTYPILLRHSSPGAREDDRARDGMAASVKFFAAESEPGDPGFLDILMNAGRQLFVRCIRDFSTFVHTPDAERIQLEQRGLMLEPQLREAYRIRGSFTESHYHTWMCFEFIDRAGVLRYVRFRLLHSDRGPDRNLPNREFRAHGRPSMEPVEGDPRAPDFLRQDFAYKVRHSDVRYVLQAQLREAPTPAPLASHELFDPSQPWNEHWYPCLDLCEIRLREVIDDEPTLSALEWNPNRSPSCLRIPLATSPDHYASLGHARALVYPGSRAIRAAAPHPQNN